MAIYDQKQIVLKEKTKEEEKQLKKVLRRKGFNTTENNHDDGIADLQQIELDINAEEQNQLIFDGQKVGKSDIENVINNELKRFMDMKLDRIKDSVPALIGRFE